MGTDGSRTEVKIQLLEPGGALAGTVSGPDGQPVAGAVVRVGTREVEPPVSSLGLPSIAVPVRTDAEGRFRALGLEAGEQRVFVRATGLAPWQGTCFISTHATAALRVDLGAGATIAGIVRDAEGRPAADVDISTGKSRDLTDSSTETALDGSFTLTDLAAAELEVRAWHQHLGKAKAVVASRAGATVHCELTLSHGIELRGRVLDETGAPVAGVHVGAFRTENSGDGASDDTDREGRFTLINLPKGLLTVLTVVESQETRREQVDPAQGPIELRVHRPAPVLEPSAFITGRVLGPDGRAEAGIMVSAYTATHDRGEVATGADGTFKIGPLRPGAWTVYLQPQQHPTLALPPHDLDAGATWDAGPLQLVEGGTASIQVTGVPAGGDVTFTVRDGTGRPHGAGWTGEHQLRTWMLAPGDYKVVLACDGCARRAVPFTIRAGGQTSIEARLEPGVRQRFEFVRADGVKLTRELIHSLRCGDEVLIGDQTVLYWDRPAVYAADGAMTAALWFARGNYRLDVREHEVAGTAAFTVGESEAGPLRIVLR
jgi:protocatechuate 3,4-dioxygenase beta subunit